MTINIGRFRLDVTCSLVSFIAVVWACNVIVTLPRVTHITQATATMETPCNLAGLKILTLGHVKYCGRLCSIDISPWKMLIILLMMIDKGNTTYM